MIFFLAENRNGWENLEPHKTMPTCSKIQKQTQENANERDLLGADNSHVNFVSFSGFFLIIWYSSLSLEKNGPSDPKAFIFIIFSSWPSQNAGLDAWAVLVYCVFLISDSWVCLVVLLLLCFGCRAGHEFWNEWIILCGFLRRSHVSEFRYDFDSFWRSKLVSLMGLVKKKKYTFFFFFFCICSHFLLY